MGRVIVSAAVSVDGFMEGRGGDLSVMPLDEGFNVHNAALIDGATNLLYGGNTYRQMLGYWPNVPGNPDASEAEQRIARRIGGGLSLFTVSDSLSPEDTGPWREQTTIVRREDASAAVAALRNADGDTVVFGSRMLWVDLLAHGLVDELYLLIGPRIVSGDTPAFAGAPDTDLRLLGVDRPDGSDLVILHYAVAH